MKTKFLYGILQYRHSLLSSEAIDIGILFYFPEQNTIKFSFSGRISKLSLLYFEFNYPFYKKYLKVIEEKVNAINTKSDLFKSIQDRDENLKAIIDDKIINEDATTLQFTGIKRAIVAFHSVEKIIADYNKLYFTDKPKPTADKHSEGYLLRKFDQLLKETNQDISKNIKKPRIISVNGFKWKFDRSWKNGTTNLIKPISFDLLEEKAIQDKSFQYLGYLSKFSDLAKKEKYKFDFLVAAPRKHELKDFYQEALKIIANGPAPNEIITESKLKEYTQHAAQHLVS